MKLWCPEWEADPNTDPCDAFYAEATVTVYLGAEGDIDDRGDYDYNVRNAECSDHLDRRASWLTEDQWDDAYADHMSDAGYRQCVNCADWTRFVNTDDVCDDCTGATPLRPQAPTTPMFTHLKPTARSAWMS